MTTTTKLTLDRVVRIIVTLGLTLSVLGMPAVVPVAQAKPAVAQPVSEPKVEATPVVDATPTPEATPVVEATPTMTLEATLPAVAVENLITDTTVITPAPTAQARPQLPEQAKPAMQSMGQLAAKGGRLRSTDERLQLEFPEGALKDAVDVRYGIKYARPYNNSDTHASLVEFDLEALKTDKLAQEEKVSHFEKPFTLTINLTGLIDLNQIPKGYYVYLYTLTPEGYQTPVWPLQADPAAGTISAQVDHFSGWGAGIAPGVPGVWEFHYTPPDVDMHSGA
ncbi:MAG TPA: hypothetical protein VMP08_08770, partial [Anaerolineae bacterium]|nr:hypothetical protein [Anaerolineae bacterium]